MAPTSDRTRSDEALSGARRCFQQRRWSQAHSLLSEVDREAPLEPEDLERLALAARLLGRDRESDEAWERAYRAFLDAGDARGAARCAFWLGFGLLFLGEVARGGGWLARAEHVLEDRDEDCVELGYLRLPNGLRLLAEGHTGAALAVFEEATGLGERFGDPDLEAMGRLGSGQSLIRLGRFGEGLTLLDEAMVGIAAGEASAHVVGLVYCGVIEACHEAFDLRRAQEWTSALSRWCDEQPDLVPFRGQCLVHRSELLQLRGEWPDAALEASRACEWLTRPPARPEAGMAFYQRAELHRLRGEFSDAEEAYRRASEWGRSPQPGLALLRLAQGQVEAAEAAVRRLLAEQTEPSARSGSLIACVEVLLASGDLVGAREAADELALLTEALESPLASAVSAHARGAVLLAEGDASGALAALEDARRLWGELEAPYEVARVGALIGLACFRLGDLDTGRMELEASGRVLERLGAVPDLTEVRRRLTDRSEAPRPGGLTDREVEVLSLVAAGKSNREVAHALYISEHTVRRHLQNVFAKLGVSTRAAATAFAVRQGLA